MKESLSGPKPKLTKIEAHQAERRGVYAEGENHYAVWRHSIISEPEGVYEQDFKKLSVSDKHEKLIKQIETSAEMTIRLGKYIETNFVELDKVSDEDAYKILCKVAFETDNESEITYKFALSQRRGFKLSIVNFLEEQVKLIPYRIEAEAGPDNFAEKYLKEEFTGKVDVESLSIGFVIYLDEQDYALIDSANRTLDSITSAGRTISRPSLPPELKSRIIIINKGGPKRGLKSKEQLLGTRDHEIRHILFSQFHAQQNEMYAYEVREELPKCRTEKDFSNLSARICEDIVEKAKDEIIAYFRDGDFDISNSDLRFDLYQWRILEVKKNLRKRDDLSKESKKAILANFIADKRKCLEIIGRMRFVAENMYKQGDESQNNFSEALLRNTPGMKIHRLAKYASLSEDKIKNLKRFNRTGKVTIS